MKSKLNRRDFLKLAGLLPLSLAAPRFLQPPSNQKNVLVVIFDAFSAYNASLYGYERETTPNIARLAERAIVYNKHYAASNYTTTGTASLLSGTLLWTHRAFHYNSVVAAAVETHNIYNAFPGYHRIGYTHNILVNTLLRQFKSDMEEWIPREQLLLGSYGKFIQTLFGKDEDIASIGWARNIKVNEAGYAYSLLLSRLYEPLQESIVKSVSARFPLGIPSISKDDRFVLEDAIDYLGERLPKIPQPFMGYFHFLPPHDPYRTPLEFFGRFKKDGFTRAPKPLGPLDKKKEHLDLLRDRTAYDEFILYADKEFGRFYEYLESAGILENTILVLTSDHGELHERGISGHSTDVLYEPLLRVPLLIFEPGRKTRLDINTPTSAIDLLPTLTQLAGLPIPDWNEGVVLPPFNSDPVDPERGIYAIRSFYTKWNAPINNFFSIALIKERYKLHYYFGYAKLQGGELIHLFDVEADPEELVDLAETHKDVADQMLAEIKAQLAEVNQPYL
jgi:arylsulfatase A-like enzyme